MTENTSDEMRLSGPGPIDPDVLARLGLCSYRVGMVDCKSAAVYELCPTGWDDELAGAELPLSCKKHIEGSVVGLAKIAGAVLVTVIGKPGDDV